MLAIIDKVAKLFVSFSSAFFCVSVDQPPGPARGVPQGKVETRLSIIERISLILLITLRKTVSQHG